MLARIRKAEENDQGFTLIELLVVVIIIGILSAIAIPTFLSQREKGWDKAVKADLRNNAMKMEEARDDSTTGAYPTTVPTGDYAFKQSDNVGATSIQAGRPAGVFCIQATSPKLGTADNATQHFLSTVGKPADGACPAVS
jgi:type IV pilus assembly protein PilA